MKALCPQWSDATKNTLMTDQAAVKSMLDLSADDANKIGPLCSEMKHQLDLIDTMRGGRLIDPAVYASAQSMQRFGCHLVQFHETIGQAA